MRRLTVDTSTEGIKRISTILDQNSIKYEVRSERSRGTIGMGLDAAAYARANLAMYKGASDPTFIYSVYVNLKDYKRAKKLIG
ncbi:MAG: hypothetical protein JW987_04380 [Anaerolineaceae bacterium]|nr:hypothetical protein [Anaerolineaceae bacterium]